MKHYRGHTIDLEQTLDGVEAVIRFQGQILAVICAATNYEVTDKAKQHIDLLVEKLR